MPSGRASTQPGLRETVESILTVSVHLTADSTSEVWAGPGRRAVVTWVFTLSIRTCASGEISLLAGVGVRETVGGDRDYAAEDLAYPKHTFYAQRWQPSNPPSWQPIQSSAIGF